jgi:hypothetical protein
MLQPVGAMHQAQVGVVDSASAVLCIGYWQADTDTQGVGARRRWGQQLQGQVLQHVLEQWRQCRRIQRLDEWCCRCCASSVGSSAMISRDMFA